MSDTIESAEAFAERWFPGEVEIEYPQRETLRVQLKERDAAIVELCAERLGKRGHHYAANSLRKMLREGRLLP